MWIKIKIFFLSLWGKIWLRLWWRGKLSFIKDQPEAIFGIYRLLIIDKGRHLIFKGNKKYEPWIYYRLNTKSCYLRIFPGKRLEKFSVPGLSQLIGITKFILEQNIEEAIRELRIKRFDEDSK